jgi:predicted extracellular nuclease
VATEIDPKGFPNIVFPWLLWLVALSIGLLLALRLVVLGLAVSTSLVVNEIDYDQPSQDAAEFIELKNISSNAIDLDLYSLALVNGATGTVYRAIELPAESLPAGDYFVVCANAATVANCDLDATPDIDLIQNGGPDAVALMLGATLVDTVSYEGDTAAPYTEGSGVGLSDDPVYAQWSIGRCPEGGDSDQNNLDFIYRSATPGALNTCPAPVTCGDPYTPIFTIQGSGTSSPLSGTEVATEGVVVGDFQIGGLNGFYIQDATGDGDPATSDGIFIYAPGAAEVAAGDWVRVRGDVYEYGGLTEVAAAEVGVCSTGNSVPPTALALPVTSLGAFEPYEGMLVTFPQVLYLAESFNFDRYGEIILTTTRQSQPTALYAPGSPEAAQLAQSNLLGRITLDDGRSLENPDPALHPNGEPFDLSNLFRGGDTLQDVTGVLDYRYNLYRLQPTRGAIYTTANLRLPVPEAVGGSTKVASLNVLNYFTTLDSGPDICGPQQNLDCRGANTPEELVRQRTKIIAALAAIDADVVGLIEIENELNDAALKDLVNGLNDALGASTYAYIDTGVIGTDAIKVALIYKPAAVIPAGAYAILDSSIDPRFIDTRNRPALAQTFFTQNGGVFTVAINHLKSRSSPCGTGDDDPEQGNCNGTRLLAAQALVDWLASDPTGSGDADFLILGDLNAYDKEDPIAALTAGGYTDLLRQFIGEMAYTYTFDGQLGYLDYALASPSLLPQVTGVTTWHINADEADLLNYDMTYKLPAQDALYEPNAFRAADHDPVVLGLVSKPSFPAFLPVAEK